MQGNPSKENPPWRRFSYLITGDTEIPRWDTIKSSLAAHSNRASLPHLKDATHPASLLNIAPHTVLISAGADGFP